MKPPLFQLDEQTLRSLNRVARPGKRKQAIREAIRQAQFRAMREAYGRQPDASTDSDDWSTSENYKP